jgi:hypothetical protein
MNNSSPVAFIVGSGLLFGAGTALYLAMTGAGPVIAFIGYAGGGQIGILAAACCIAVWR